MRNATKNRNKALKKFSTKLQSDLINFCHTKAIVHDSSHNFVAKGGRLEVLLILKQYWLFLNFN